MAGIALGLLGAGLAAALGLAALIDAFPPVYNVLRWAGVLYLLWLAWEGWRGSEGSPVEAGRIGWAQAVYFRRGLITNLLNPKAFLFYLASCPASSIRRAIDAADDRALAALCRDRHRYPCRDRVLAGAARPMIGDRKGRIIRRALSWLSPVSPSGLPSRPRAKPSPLLWEKVVRGRSRAAQLIPASQTPVTLPLPLFTRGFVVTGSFTGRAGGPRQDEFSDSFLTRSTPTLRPTGTRTGLRLVVRLKPVRKASCPGRWRAGGMGSKQPRGALMKRHTNYKPRCFVSAPLPPRPTQTRKDLFFEKPGSPGRGTDRCLAPKATRRSAAA